jgi:hypothetical protein
MTEGDIQGVVVSQQLPIGSVTTSWDAVAYEVSGLQVKSLLAGICLSGMCASLLFAPPMLALGSFIAFGGGTVRFSFSAIAHRDRMANILSKRTTAPSPQ